MRRLWLLFAQTVTICLGILFIVATLRPDWLHTQPQAPAPLPAPQPSAPVSFAAAVAQARPAVVNVYTSKHVNVPVIPIPADPELERLFREIPGFSRRRESTNLGSG